MGKTKKKIGIQKIEVDSKTSEPKIVGIEEEYDLNAVAEEAIKQTEAEKNNQSSIGKQLVMTRILGIQKYDNGVDKRQKFFKRIISIVFILFVVGVLAFTFYKDFFSDF